MALLEVVVYDYKSAIVAALCGADRLEVCDNYKEGGTTPSLGLVSLLLEKLDVPVFPMIRPRGGDFLYLEEEIDVMIQDIIFFKELGCQGVVLGVLRKDGTVDYQNLSRLVETAYPMNVTFHRAFDRARNFEQALNLIYEAGCNRVLTSGGKPTVKEGLEQLRLFASLANDNLKIIAGGGVEQSSVADLLSIGIEEIHTPARRIAPSEMDFVNTDMMENLDHISVDTAELKKIVELVRSYNNSVRDNV